MPEVQVKLDVINEAPEWVCLVCDGKGTWRDAAMTGIIATAPNEVRRFVCPKCLDKGYIIHISEYADLNTMFSIRSGALERINQQRKELGLPLLKMKKER
jgi:hypothetical protein